MKRYEYKVLHVLREYQINAYGKDGWWIVKAENITEWSGARGTYTTVDVVMERELEEKGVVSG